MAVPEYNRASLIARCTNPLPENVISQYGKRVIRVSDHEVVKCGPDVTKEEADNQRIAHGLLENRLVRVPRVFDFFSDEQDCGYIVMEYIDGTVMDPADDSALRKVADLMDYFATLRHTNPGSLCGGPCRGILFPETEDLLFDNLDHMERWFNSRLLPSDPNISFQGCDLVFCHLDLAPRNILLQKDGTICLVDWASAGYYPRLFEFSAQWIFEGRNDSFNPPLMDLVIPLSAIEMASKDSFLRAWRNIQRYAL
ncbi:unnamed protein product [Penicillium olsonii]|uniref:Protein kinase domain-containing protein n=1 Tax=Penicillium olsonii TaxID=99116 RepID=A0A9W4MRC3_PENOL|nr:unnamed protein product [Penicillium olsonii]CAG8229041.1 unnamed protein product [Penicillium olsonii]